MCFRPPAWLALPDRVYEPLALNDAIYCGETEPRADGELVALCDYHQRIHHLGIYGDAELVRLLESSQ